MMLPPRSLSVQGGGYDRVGGSRLTGFGAMLLMLILVGLVAPPSPTDQQLAAVVWLAFVAIFAVGVVVPMVLVRRISLEATSPRDATVGDEVPIRVEVRGRCRGVQLRALDPTGAWFRTSSPGSGELTHLADTRGVFPAIRIEVRVSAPLGVLASHRVHWVWLPTAVEVAPRPTPVRWNQPKPVPIEGDSGRFDSTSAGDLVRTVRPYVSGDPARLVHWPSSARLGQLVVRELEPPTPVGAAVVVDLTDLDDRTEAAASVAFGACRAVLAEGGNLLVCTCEAGGPVVDIVRTPLDAGRRLARAVPGPPAEPPPGWPVMRIGP